jgi:hypothetical protein
MDISSSSSSYNTNDIHVRTLLKQMRDMKNKPYDIIYGGNINTNTPLQQNDTFTVGQCAYQYLFGRWLRKKKNKRNRAQQKKHHNLDENQRNDVRQKNATNKIEEEKKDESIIHAAAAVANTSFSSSSSIITNINKRSIRSIGSKSSHSSISSSNFHADKPYHRRRYQKRFAIHD